MKIGSKVTYTIQVWNERDAPDQNVQVVATLPNSLEFDSADGPVNAKHDGKKVTFEPIESLQPDDRAEYTVIAKAIGSGNARFEAALTSELLKQKIGSGEPTRLFDTAGHEPLATTPSFHFPRRALPDCGEDCTN